uniref:Uncharacterized protein n=1 Tax=Rhipicephalus zambeziensis TaxID=60191 RepID=A0A224YFV5_9ACAR
MNYDMLQQAWAQTREKCKRLLVTFSFLYKILKDMYDEQSCRGRIRINISLPICSPLDQRCHSSSQFCTQAQRRANLPADLGMAPILTSQRRRWHVVSTAIAL